MSKDTNFGQRAIGRRLAWIVALVLVAALVVGMQIRVTALKSQVRLAEKRIVYLKRDKMYLETEFETRANQQQLKAWNAVEFGYVAPRASQYLEGESKLAALGKPIGPEAPAQIRVASADIKDDDSVLPALVSPITGKPLGDDSDPKPVDREQAAANLGARLIKVDHQVKKSAAGKLIDEARRL